MPKFRITWEDPETGETQEQIMEFHDWIGRAKNGEGKKFGPTIHISAQEWAEDFAYTIADKGQHKVEKIE